MSTQEINLVIIGDGSCGKSSLLYRYCRGSFPQSNPDDSPFEMECGDISVKGTKVELVMCDTGGGPNYDCLRKLSYDSADVIIICYAVNDPVSLSNVYEIWKPEIIQNSTSQAPLILVGTKSELRSREFSNQNVSPGEGRDVSQRIGAADFLECSAKTGENVKQLFLLAAEVGLDYSKLKKKKSCIIS